MHLILFLKAPSHETNDKCSLERSLRTEVVSGEMAVDVLNEQAPVSNTPDQLVCDTEEIPDPASSNDFSTADASLLNTSQQSKVRIMMFLVLYQKYNALNTIFISSNV